LNSGDYYMFFRIHCIKKEEGMTLIEVMAALVLLSLLAVTLLSIFSTSGSWIRGTGKKTIAVQYANSIMDMIKADSLQLLNIDFTKDPAMGGSIEVSDNNESDDVFGFLLEQEQEVAGVIESVEVFKIEVPAPATPLKATATINISPHEDISYYPDDDGDGNPDNELPFGGNLFDVKVKIEWAESGYSSDIEIFTVMGAQ
jgi:prepilin-type N-terminal cleavage/methylation domain-containing protein